MIRAKVWMNSLFKFLLAKRTEKSLTKIIGKRINILKRNGQYRIFPISSCPPLIAEYPFLNRKYLKWLDFFYTIHGKANAGFIPLPVYYNFIEPRLNNSILTSAIKEKNFYDKFLKNIKTPPTILRRLNGSYCDINYRPIDLDDALLNRLLETIPVVILKPSLQSGSGRSIFRFCRRIDRFFSGDQELNVDYLNKFSNDFVLQIFIKQHKFFVQFNPESNNTIRVLTYRSVRDDHISILHTLLRIGSKGSFLDHDNLGGVAISINELGVVNDYAYDVHGKKFESFNGITFNTVGRVPLFDQICQTATNVADQVHYGRLLAMDFTVDHDGEVLLIEINCKGNGISQYQYSSGSLFKEFTKEILDYCNHCSTKININQTKVN